ncbi:hypothetical protein [Paraglaciecola sp. 2405UD69-4]|uniref:hypothetical protein n=1 Tax=Paraglaciecola sp. 2405UD69-4 TaxID=3391836 RepID=UPI0039C8D121
MVELRYVGRLKKSIFRFGIFPDINNVMSRIKLKRFFCFIICVVLVACTKNTDKAPNEADLTEHYNKYQSSFEKLKKMIINDSRDLDNFQIREGKIGEYDLTEKGWSKEYGHYVPFSIVTGSYLLTNARYDNYVSLLKLTKASAVHYHGGNVSITIFSAGFVFGGCSSKIVYQPETVSLSRPSWATTYYQAYFNKNWGGNTQCN